jgi:hypothetical protein
MMFIGNLSTLWTAIRYMSNAAFEAAYGLVGCSGVSSRAAKATEP